MREGKIKRAIGNAWLWIVYLFSGAMKGMGDKITQQRHGSGGENEINEKLSIGGVMNDLLEERETQEVKELRDTYYRVLNEADKYRVNVIWSDTGPLSANIKKVGLAYFDKNIDVFNPGLKPIRVIQDNVKIQKHSSFDAGAVIDEFKAGNVLNYDTLITMKRSFLPRFEIEKFANKVVVLGDGDHGQYDIHIYTTMYASQFGKIDALYIAELNRMKTVDGYKTEIVDIDEISFFTDKAYHCENRCEFKFVNIKYKGIEVYDGNFVIMFTGVAEVDGVQVGEKYKTDSLDLKYKNNEPKKNTIDVFTLDRNLNKNKNYS